MPFHFVGHHEHAGTEDKLNRILHYVRAILARESRIMADVSSVKQLIADIDVETNAVAAKIDAQTAAIKDLTDKVAAGGVVSQADLDAISASLSTESDRLKALGADASNPIPVDANDPIRIGTRPAVQADSKPTSQSGTGQ